MNAFPRVIYLPSRSALAWIAILLAVGSVCFKRNNFESMFNRLHNEHAWNGAGPAPCGFPC